MKEKIKKKDFVTLTNHSTAAHKPPPKTTLRTTKEVIRRKWCSERALSWPGGYIFDIESAFKLFLVDIFSI
jgi:hypothetical protein